MTVTVDPRVRTPPASADPRTAPLALMAAVVAVTVVLWVAGGALGRLSQPAGGWLVFGQIAGLTAALSALAGLVLVARPGRVERGAGLDRLWAWHRVVGIVTVLALLGHVVASSVGFAGGSLGGAVGEVISLMATTPWMVAAVVAAALFFTIALTSWRRLRQRMAYETWLAVHVTGYLAVILGFGHQVTMGTDLTEHRAMLLWWGFLAAATAGIVVWSRAGGLVRAMVDGRGVVVGSSSAGPGMTALQVRAAGRRIARAKAGQFFLLRFVTRDLWWQAHPVSLSDRPHDGLLRFTVKNLGDGSALIQTLPVGTKVVLEGPYGRFTADRADGEPVVLIGGGVGLAPLLAVLADCHPQQRPVVVARVRRRDDIPHARELEHAVAARDGRLFVVDGPRRRWNNGHPFAADVLTRAVPDIATRQVFVCGPSSLVSAVERGLRAAGVPNSQVHLERFGV